MLHLDTKLTLNAETIKAKNLTSRFSESDLTKLGGWVYEGYKKDKESRSRWERRNQAGMDLALQMQRAKTFPWVGCSNVAFPLVTIAAMQFHARAYPSVISGTDVVKTRTLGPDPDGTLLLRSQRISSHMSWQCLEEDTSWEEQHDRGLLNLAIVGCNFMKSYYDAREGHNVSELVLAKDLVLNYYSKSVEAAKRKTHCVPLDRDVIYERVRRGVYADVLESNWFNAFPTQSTTESNQSHEDRRQGVEPPQPDEVTPFRGLEQHVMLDLDRDGYPEPYIITLEAESQTVLRLVTGFDREEDVERLPDGRIISIQRQHYFTKYSFIPAADGGIYDIGFGVLLGPLNESVNTAINQIFDAGTMATTAGGFLARGAKIRGGTYTFAPFGWQRVDSTGDDLRKSIFPLPVREPSTILFQLLTLLIDYTNRISGSTDMLVGENPGQNTPAETSRAMVEQGTKIFNAIFKRVWRCMKEEFRKLYILNAIYLPDESRFGAAGAWIRREDYFGNPQTVAPAADPNLSSKTERIQLAMAIKAAAAQNPGYDPDKVENFYLSALEVPADQISQLYPGVAGKQPGPSEKVQIQMLKNEAEEKSLQADMAKFGVEIAETRRLNSAQITKIQGDLAIAAAAAQGDETDRQINAMNTQLGLLKQHDQRLAEQAERIFRTIELQQKQEDLRLTEKKIDGDKQRKAA